jgi:hypothetical protein
MFGALLVGEREVANGAVTVCPSTMPERLSPSVIHSQTDAAKYWLALNFAEVKACKEGRNGWERKSAFC